MTRRDEIRSVTSLLLTSRLRLDDLQCALWGLRERHSGPARGGISPFDTLDYRAMSAAARASYQCLLLRNGVEYSFINNPLQV